MHRDQLDAGGLGAPRQFGRVERSMIPTEPHLQRHGHLHCRDGRLDQSQRVIEIAHQGRTGLAAGDVARRAAHVDINDVSASGLRDPRAFGHPMCLTAGELNDMRAEPGRLRPEQGHRPSPRQIVAGGHLRDDQPRAKRCHLPAERHVRNPRHRREQHPIGDFDIANLERWSHRRCRVDQNDASLTRTSRCECR